MHEPPIERNRESMGRFWVEIEVRNHQDVILAAKGILPEAEVRQVRIRGLVDTGATDLVLPSPVVAALGLPELKQVAVRYADNRRAVRAEVGDVEVEIQGRCKVFTAIVEPDRPEALIGAIILEALDFVVNAKDHKLEPRDPLGLTAAIGCLEVSKIWAAAVAEDE